MSGEDGIEVVFDEPRAPPPAQLPSSRLPEKPEEVIFVFKALMSYSKFQTSYLNAKSIFFWLADALASL